MNAAALLRSLPVRAAKFLRSLPGGSARLSRALGALMFHEFRSTLQNPRFLTLCALVAIPLLLLTRALALAAAASPAPPSQGAPVWTRGGDGALVALAYAFLPILLPFLPIIVATGADRKERRDGFLEVALSRSVPRWGVALGRYLGFFVAVATVELVLLAAAVGIVAATTGDPISGALLVGIIVGAFLFSGLWLGLALVLMSFFTPGQVRWLSFPFWAAFSAIRPTGLIIGGQFLSIVPIRGYEVFLTHWGDWLSFSGLYQAFLAPFVPDLLAFVVRPDASSAGDVLAYALAPIGCIVWLGALLIVHARLTLVAPLGRRVLSDTPG